MIEDILDFYRKSKLKKELRGSSPSNGAPVTFTHVFHKKYPRLKSFNLPNINLSEGADLNKVLASRKSSREFIEEPLTLDELSTIMGSIRILERRQEFERRTYPSGGARFPVEVYPIIFNVNGLSKGVYHYNFTDHSLELLWEKDLSVRLEDLVSESILYPAATLFMTSALSRSEIKYGNKAFGYSMIEAGHMAQNMSLVAQSIGIGSCAVGGFIDDDVIDILDLVQQEIPIYSLALGKITKK